MKLHFESSQEFQLRAVEAVMRLLEGQPRVPAYQDFFLGDSLAAIPNALGLDAAALLKNLNAVQADNGIKPDAKLECIEGPIETAGGTKQISFANFSVEMETGTGKTYVYLRTALELFQRYGLRKFIVVVPSIAIKEGVLKTLEITQTHFQELYGNLPYRFYVYDSDNLSQVRQFAQSEGVEIMVMTLDSFNKASNVIRQSTDRLQGETPIHLVQAARPILILDEPQNMESELSVKALAALDPLFALRYSATHRNPYNVIYRLTPFEAYRQGLVKRIEVASVLKEGDANQVFLRLEDIRSEKSKVTARIALHKLMKDATVKEKTVTVRPGDSLEKLAGREAYAGYDVDEISPGGGFVRFGNNIELNRGESRGADKEAVFEAQIRYTIEEHFQRQAHLRSHGIKVLSLFFIDRVANYAPEDGIIRRLFNSAFEELKKKHPEWKNLDAARVQAAYFAEKRRAGGVAETLDSVSGKTKEDEAAYDLIMKDKEKLLSFDEPVSFIFSHSALREGWDNPNVFQICTLNQTASDVKKRQEVGRGVRLAVDQKGDRIKDERINVLTVIANESYERYVESLQSEIEEAYGKEGLPPKPANARQRKTSRLRKEFLPTPEFRNLWERIKHKTRYAVKIDDKKLLADVLPALDKADIRPPRVVVTKAEVAAVEEGGGLRAAQTTGAHVVQYVAGRQPLPNLVDIMSGLMEHTTPPVRLSRRTLLEVIRRSKQKKAVVENPHEFATTAVGLLKEKLAEQLVDGIRYEKIDSWYEMTQFEAEVESWENYLVPANRALYDQVEVESEVERRFIEGLESRNDVRFYVKLPGWFAVPTPVGEYNPDWAIVMDETDAHGKPTGGKSLYLVRETKDEDWLKNPRLNDKRKIDCGKKHFQDALKTDFKVVSKASELP